MTMARLALVVAGTAIFAAWALFMFRTLFLLRRRAKAENGGREPGPLQTLRQWANFFRNPRDRALRYGLTGLTLALIAWLVVLANAGT